MPNINQSIRIYCALSAERSSSTPASVINVRNFSVRAASIHGSKRAKRKSALTARIILSLKVRLVDLRLISSTSFYSVAINAVRPSYMLMFSSMLTLVFHKIQNSSNRRKSRSFRKLKVILRMR
jgi:hypothetical protein